CTPDLVASVDYFKNAGTDSLDGAGGMRTFFGGTYPTLTWTTFMKGALAGKPIRNFELAPGLTPTATPTPTGTALPGEPTGGPTGLPTLPGFPGFPFPEDTTTPEPTITSAPTQTSQPTVEPTTPATTQPEPTPTRTRRPIFPRDEEPAARSG